MKKSKSFLQDAECNKTLTTSLKQEKMVFSKIFSGTPKEGLNLEQRTIHTRVSRRRRRKLPRRKTKWQRPGPRDDRHLRDFPSEKRAAGCGRKRPAQPAPDTTNKTRPTAAHCHPDLCRHEAKQEEPKNLHRANCRSHRKEGLWTHRPSHRQTEVSGAPPCKLCRKVIFLTQSSTLSQTINYMWE